ncbi:hypothetical protein GF336_00635 [Candidatus Woesearchaeota archaeon]|nr:hypothetical protein [Candidatus Woesearchaeota archaeon]
MKKIKLIDKFEENIATRESVVDFFRWINKLVSKDIMVDFNEIEFISRSAAHEYLRQSKKSKKNISNVNMGSEVENMFEYVKSEKDIKKKSNKSPSQIKISTICI